MYVHDKVVFECESVEKKVKRISIRVPASWKSKCQERAIPISHICRSALWQALNASDEILKSGSTIRQKGQAASLFNALLDLRVRTITPDLEDELKQKVFKTLWFRAIMIPKCSPQELMILGEFLDQGEFAEEILQGAYK